MAEKRRDRQLFDVSVSGLEAQKDFARSILSYLPPVDRGRSTGQPAEDIERHQSTDQQLELGIRPFDEDVRSAWSIIESRYGTKDFKISDIRDALTIADWLYDHPVNNDIETKRTNFESFARSLSDKTGPLFTKDVIRTVSASMTDQEADISLAVGRVLGLDK